PDLGGDRAGAARAEPVQADREPRARELLAVAEPPLLDSQIRVVLVRRGKIRMSVAELLLQDRDAGLERGLGFLVLAGARVHRAQADPGLADQLAFRAEAALADREHLLQRIDGLIQAPGLEQELPLALERARDQRMVVAERVAPHRH